MLSINPDATARQVVETLSKMRGLIGARLAQLPPTARPSWVVVLATPGSYLLAGDGGPVAATTVLKATTLSAAMADAHVAAIAGAEMVTERAALLREYTALGEMVDRLSPPIPPALLLAARGGEVPE